MIYQVLRDKKGNAFVVAAYLFDPDPQRIGELLEGEVPLFLWNVGSSWKVAFPRDLADILNFPLGNAISEDRFVCERFNYRFLGAEWTLRWNMNQAEMNGDFTFVLPWGLSAQGEIARADECNQDVFAGHLLDWGDYPEWLVTVIRKNTLTTEEVRSAVTMRIETTMRTFPEGNYSGI